MIFCPETAPSPCRNTRAAADEEYPEVVLVDELILSSTCIGSQAETPHCSRKNYAPKALLTTELVGHAQVLYAQCERR